VKRKKAEETQEAGPPRGGSQKGVVGGESGIEVRNGERPPESLEG